MLVCCRVGPKVENIDGRVLSKEVLSFRTFGGLSFEEF